MRRKHNIRFFIGNSPDDLVDWRRGKRILRARTRFAPRNLSSYHCLRVSYFIHLSENLAFGSFAVSACSRPACVYSGFV